MKKAIRLMEERGLSFPAAIVQAYDIGQDQSYRGSTAHTHQIGRKTFQAAQQYIYGGE